jgi:hypothetical protein
MERVEPAEEVGFHVRQVARAVKPGGHVIVSTFCYMLEQCNRHAGLSGFRKTAARSPANQELP